MNIKLNIEGMSCIGCAKSIEKKLKNIKSINKIYINFSTNIAEID